MRVYTRDCPLRICARASVMSRTSKSRGKKSGTREISSVTVSICEFDIDIEECELTRQDP